MAAAMVGGDGGVALIVSFDAKSAAAISNRMIMAASASSFWYNLTVPHPCREAPILDYDLALLFQPMLMFGITIGVVFPYWLIIVLIIILFVGTSSRSCAKAIKMWKEETVSNNKAMEDGQTFADSCQEVLINPEEQLVPREPKTATQIMKGNLDLKRMCTLVLVWIVFLLLQVIKNETEARSPVYWFLSLLQLPVALAVFGYKSVTMYKESKRRRVAGNQEHICEATIDWNAMSLAFCGVLGGTVSGLLGSGGGFILGPLLLEIGVIPQVASTTAGFVMMFSSSLSVVEFYLLNRFPIPYAYGMIMAASASSFLYNLRYDLVTILKEGSRRLLRPPVGGRSRRLESSFAWRPKSAGERKVLESNTRCCMHCVGFL